MNIIFMGTPEFAAVSLRELSSSRAGIQAVFTQKDKPKNRGMKLMPSEVKLEALRLGYPVYQPDRVKDEAELIKSLSPDFIVVAAYGKILPPSILSIPKYGCVNVHASLLPKYRGASPITAAIANGDRESGVSIMKMAEGLDTGDVYAYLTVPIEADDTFGTLHDKLAICGARLLTKTLTDIENGLVPTPQREEEASYAPKIEARDCLISFSDMDRTEISNRIRAYDPRPGAFAVFEGQRYKLFSPKLLEDVLDAPAGTVKVTGKAAAVSCLGGSMEIAEIQAPGGKRMKTVDYLRGFRRPLRFE